MVGRIQGSAVIPRVCGNPSNNLFRKEKWIPRARKLESDVSQKPLISGQADLAQRLLPAPASGFASAELAGEWTWLCVCPSE